MIAIREAVPGDLPTIDELSRSAFEELRRVYRPSEGARSASFALEELPRIVVVGESGDIVGTVQYRIESPRLHLIGLAVHPAHRKTGVARWLVDHLVDLACRQNLRMLSLCAVKETGNVAVFVRLGFHAIREQADGTFIGVNGQWVADVYMERPIPGA